jgi:hypothetical protein
MILETFRQLVLGLPKSRSAARIVLVTGDAIMGEALRELYGTQVNCIIEKSFDTLSTLVNTLKSEITEDLIGKILPKAETLFYERDNPLCLWRKADIWNTLEERYLDIIETGPEEDYTVLITRTSVAPPSFVKKEGQRVTFSTKITLNVLAKKYQQSTLGQLSSLMPPGNVILSTMPTGYSTFGNPNLGFTSYPGSGIGATVGTVGSTMNLGNVGNVGNLATLAPPTKEVRVEGSQVFEAVWSAILTTRQTLSRPRLIDIKHLQATWA